MQLIILRGDNLRIKMFVINALSSNWPIKDWFPPESDSPTFRLSGFGSSFFPFSLSPLFVHIDPLSLSKQGGHSQFPPHSYFFCTLFISFFSCLEGSSLDPISPSVPHPQPLSPYSNSIPAWPKCKAENSEWPALGGTESEKKWNPRGRDKRLKDELTILEWRKEKVGFMFARIRSEYGLTGD